MTTRQLSARKDGKMIYVRFIDNKDQVRMVPKENFNAKEYGNDCTILGEVVAKLPKLKSSDPGIWSNARLDMDAFSKRRDEMATR